MRSFAVGVAGSLAASALLYFVLAATEALSLPLRLGAMALVLVLGLVVAWLASHGTRRDDEGKGASVGHRIKAEGDIAVKGVGVECSDGNVRVGDDLKSGGEVSIKDVQIRRRDRK